MVVGTLSTGKQSENATFRTSKLETIDTILYRVLADFSHTGYYPGEVIQFGVSSAVIGIFWNVCCGGFAISGVCAEIESVFWARKNRFCLTLQNIRDMLSTEHHFFSRCINAEAPKPLHVFRHCQALSFRYSGSIDVPADIPKRYNGQCRLREILPRRVESTQNAVARQDKNACLCFRRISYLKRSKREEQNRREENETYTQN